MAGCVTAADRVALYVHRAATDRYTRSLHDALPIVLLHGLALVADDHDRRPAAHLGGEGEDKIAEHTSELQSHSELVCRLLLENEVDNQVPDPVGNATIGMCGRETDANLLAHTLPVS